MNTRSLCHLLGVSICLVSQPTYSMRKKKSLTIKTSTWLDSSESCENLTGLTSPSTPDKHKPTVMFFPDHTKLQRHDMPHTGHHQIVTLQQQSQVKK